MSAIKQRIIVGISGATGSVYGIRALELLKALTEVETHLVMSQVAKRTLVEETEWSVRAVEALADHTHDDRDVGASIASGSFKTSGMIIAPCSIKMVSALAYSMADTLMARAGDVTLKEGRPLVVLARETPLHAGHLRHLLALAEIGGVIMPPVPAFYHRPSTIDEVVTHTVLRALDRLGLDVARVPEWQGLGRTARAAPSSE